MTTYGIKAIYILSTWFTRTQLEGRDTQPGLLSQKTSYSVAGPMQRGGPPRRGDERLSTAVKKLSTRWRNTHPVNEGISNNGRGIVGFFVTETINKLGYVSRRSQVSVSTCKRTPSWLKGLRQALGFAQPGDSAVLSPS